MHGTSSPVGTRTYLLLDLLLVLPLLLLLMLLLLLVLVLALDQAHHKELDHDLETMALDL